MVQVVAHFRRIVAIAVHVPEVGHAHFFQVVVNTLADADQGVLVAASQPQKLQVLGNCRIGQARQESGVQGRLIGLVIAGSSSTALQRRPGCYHRSARPRYSAEVAGVSHLPNRSGLRSNEGWRLATLHRPAPEPASCPILRASIVD